MNAMVQVEERDYGVAAKVKTRSRDGEIIPRSDRLGLAYQIQWNVRARGRDARVVEDDDGREIAVVVELGDAPDSEFCEAAGALLEAASW